jgi:uncharacterized protein (UPF0332 family)
MIGFDWLQYVDVADRLMASGTEANYRSAVSRAYYGIFGNFRRHIENNGVDFNPSRVHHDLINWLENHQDTEIQLIGRELDKLRPERNRCDYDDTVVISKERAEKYVILARAIIGKHTRLK